MAENISPISVENTSQVTFNLSCNNANWPRNGKNVSFNNGIVNNNVHSSITKRKATRIPLSPLNRGSCYLLIYNFS